MIDSGRLAHLVTLNRDGSPQVSCVWVGVDGDEIVSAHLNPAQQKIRNIRRDANQQIKDLLKDKQITEDDERRAEEEIQKLTDKSIKDVDDVVKAKEQELMAV